MDIEKLRSRIAATIEKAQTSDPRELRRRIADLEKQVSSRAPTTKFEQVIERVEVPVIGDAQLAHIQAVITAMVDLGGQLAQIAQDLGAALTRATPAQAATLAQAASGPQRLPESRSTTPARPPSPVGASLAGTSPQNGETPQLRGRAQDAPGAGAPLSPESHALSSARSHSLRPAAGRSARTSAISNAMG